LFVCKWYQNTPVQEEENQDRNQDEEKDTIVCLKYINRIYMIATFSSRLLSNLATQCSRLLSNRF